MLLCAHWEAPYCDRPATSQDLCQSHYSLHWRRGTLAPTFVTRRTGHNIDAYDEASGTGSCFICGPAASVYRTARGYLTCAFYNIGMRREFRTAWTPERYDDALIAQAGLCAICGHTPAGRGKYGTLVADHCHVTSRPRKLLCGWCNTAIGLMQDDPTALRAAAEYVS